MNLSLGIIFGVPRSGTSWLGQILNSHPAVLYRFQPIHSYSFAPTITASSSRGDVRAFYDELYATSDPYVLQMEGYTPGANQPPKFRKGPSSHLIFKETHFWDACERACQIDSRVRLVGLIRDPVDVLSSWMNHPAEYDIQWSIRDQWFEARDKNLEHPGNLFGFRAWADVSSRILELHDQIPDRVLVVKYERLRRNPLSEVGRIFRFFHLDLCKETEAFIALSTTTADSNPYSVFRAFDGDWPETLLPADLVREIQSLCDARNLTEFRRGSDR